jgi:thiol-disulfide isomerase/thioredoxin
MKRSRFTALILGAVTIAVLAGVHAGLARRAERNPSAGISSEAVARLFSTRLKDSAGKPQDLGQWRDQTLVVNFWATWCEPCRDEMPALSRLNERFSPKGVKFVGIAVDNSANVADFSKKLAVGYPLLVAGAEGIELSQTLGNTRSALPYTVVLGARGEALMTRLGRVSEVELARVLQESTGL